MSAELATIIRVEIKEGKAGLLYATSPDLRGLLVGEPDLPSLDEAVSKAIAELHEAKHGERVVVIKARRGDDPMVHPWVMIPARFFTEVGRRALEQETL